MTSSGVKDNTFGNTTDQAILGTLKIPMTQKYTQLMNQVNDKTF